jgi:hypothetical protein
MSAIFRFIYTGIVFRKASLENCRVTEQLRRAAVELPELFADYISALRRITELQDLTTTSSGGICPDPAATSSASHLSCMSTLSALPSTAVSTTGHWFGATVSDASSTFAAPMASVPCVSTFSRKDYHRSLRGPSASCLHHNRYLRGNDLRQPLVRALSGQRLSDNGNFSGARAARVGR